MDFPVPFDANVHIILKDPDATASRRDGISSAAERIHRLHGTSLIRSSCQLLQLSASCYATACVILHRCFHRMSLKSTSVWSVAMASVLLACKIEEVPLQSHRLITVFVHIYRRRCYVVLENDQCHRVLSHTAVCATEAAKTLSKPEKVNRLHKLPEITKSGPEYKEWLDALLKTENLILRHLGFVLQWIPDNHPHKFILYFLRVLEVDDLDFSQRAWNYCNDSCRLDLCVRFSSQVLASVAILLASLDFEWEIEPQDWWKTFCGAGCDANIIAASNAILGLQESALDVLVADSAFIKSEMPEDGFLGPESFIWYKTFFSES